MSLIDQIRAKARCSLKRIVLPEGDEPRTVAAAEIVRREGLAEPILLTPERMREKANDLSRGCSVDDIVNTIAMTAVQATA